MIRNMLTPIDAPNAPPANGHYTHGIAFGGLIFTSTQLPIDSRLSKQQPHDVEAQTRTVLDIIDAILRAGGSSLALAVRITLYVVDINDWPRINRAYAERLGAHKPARGVVQVSALHMGFRVAADAIGCIGD